MRVSTVDMLASLLLSARVGLSIVHSLDCGRFEMRDRKEKRNMGRGVEDNDIL